jgi:hypothetical protein
MEGVIIMIKIEFEKKENSKLALTRPMRVGGKLFLDGFKDQLADEPTIGVALAGGLWQGLKYKGNLWRGIKAGAVIELGMCAMNGVKNVMKNYHKACREERENKIVYKITKEEDK